MRKAARLATAAVTTTTTAPILTMIAFFCSRDFRAAIRAGGSPLGSGSNPPLPFPAEILLLNLVDYHTEKCSIKKDRILIAWVKKELLIAIKSSWLLLLSLQTSDISWKPLISCWIPHHSGNMTHSLAALAPYSFSYLCGTNWGTSQKLMKNWTKKKINLQCHKVNFPY